jgi:NAD(P)H dehydrogenase (quinone)
MNVFIVYWHPEPESFNHAMMETARKTFSDAGHAVRVSDLRAMGFDPVSDRRNFTTVHDAAFLKLQLEEMHATEHSGFSAELETEMRKLEWCDLMIWQFPLWWFGLPAVFKGWVDRVFAMGRTYGAGRFYETGVFGGKRALVSLTTGGPEDAYRRGGFNGDLDAILRPIHRGMLQFVGFQVLQPQVVYAPARMPESQRQEQLEGYASRLRNIDGEKPINVGIY